MEDRKPKKKKLKFKKGWYKKQGWKVDYDYVDKLTREEQEWLSQFTDEYYNGAAHLYDNPIHDPEIYTEDKNLIKNAARRDITSISEAEMVKRNSKKIRPYGHYHPSEYNFEEVEYHVED